MSNPSEFQLPHWILGALLLPFYLHGQTSGGYLANSGLENVAPSSGRGALAGLVRDAETGDLLPGVTLRLQVAGIGVVSQADGTFQIPDIPAGRYVLSAQLLGYETLILDSLDIGPNHCLRLPLALAPAAQAVGEVVVTASQRSQAIKLAPASIGVVSAREIQVRNIRTFDQAFDEMPGVVVTRSGGANVQAFSIRGASEVAGGGIGNRVLLLIDGRPALSPESGGALWNLVPLGSIERIEVIRGAYSSLYGSSAMGGVVNVITRNPAARPETRVQLHYGAYDRAPASTGYRRYNDFKTLALSHSRQIGRFSYLLDGSWKADDGHKEKSGFRLLNLYAKTAWDINPRRRLQFSVNANRIFNDTPASWLSRRQAYQVADFRRDDYQHRRELNADLYYQATPSDRLKYTSRLYFYANASDFDFNAEPGNDSTNINTGKQAVAASSVRTNRLGNISQIEYFSASGHCVLAGLDLKTDYVLGQPDSVLYGEHRAHSAGVYLQDEFVLGKKWTLTAGLRYDFFVIPGETQSSNLSPKLALLYQAHSKLALRALLAQAFRDPPMAERFIKFEQGGGLRFLPNPQLQPERLDLSAELGAKYSPAPGLSFDLAFFYNHYRNLISFQQLSNPFEPLLYQVINLKGARMQGLEFSYRQQLGKTVTINAFYTFLDARDISTERINDALAYKVRHSAGMGATWTQGPFSLNGNCRYRSRIEEVFIYPGSEPGAVFVANAKAGYLLLDGRLNTFFAVNNLLDAQYEELERYRMPGRSFTIGLEWRL